jgi:hypothetical protein
MAVIKAKAEKVVEFAYALVERELITPSVVTRVSEDLFKGAEGDTVNFRVGGLRTVARDYEFRTRTAPIQFDDIAGGDSLAIQLDQHIYSATTITDEQRTLDEIEFAREVIQPQANAVVDRLETKVVTALRGATFNPAVEGAGTQGVIEFGDGEDPHLVALEAYRRLNSWGVAPAAGRVYLVGTDIAANFLASDRLTQYDSLGVSGTPAVRDATIGRLSGSPVIVHNGLNPDEGYYIHKSALILGTVAPVIPEGVTKGSRLSKNGSGLRWIADYDPQYLRDRSIVSMFAGINELLDARVGGTGQDQLDLLPEVNQYNARIIKLDFTGTGNVLTP